MRDDLPFILLFIIDGLFTTCGEFRINYPEPFHKEPRRLKHKVGAVIIFALFASFAAFLFLIIAGMIVDALST